jgi:hypothetical protein
VNLHWRTVSTAKLKRIRKSTQDFIKGLDSDAIGKEVRADMDEESGGAASDMLHSMKRLCSFATAELKRRKAEKSDGPKA